MYIVPENLVGRLDEWSALEHFVIRRARFGVVYGPRRVGKSYLLNEFVTAVGGWRYQAIGGTSEAQRNDFGQMLGEFLNVGHLRITDWRDALNRIASLDVPVVVIDELPYLLEQVPELPGLLQRHVDKGVGPSLIVCGSAIGTMRELVESKAPLFGRSAMTLVPKPLSGSALSELWGTKRPHETFWVDCALGGLPGYRPLVESPTNLDDWMVRSVLAPSSPLLDAGEILVHDLSQQAPRAVSISILRSVAAGNRTAAKIATGAGIAVTALPRPLRALERAGLIVRVHDALRNRRDQFVLSDPYVHLWLTVISPNRLSLASGAANRVWERVKETTWPSQMAGPRWESAVRSHVSSHMFELFGLEATSVGVTTISDRSDKASHEIDLVVTNGTDVLAIGESKLRRLTLGDYQRLDRIRKLLKAPHAIIVLASTTSVAEDVPSDAVSLSLADVYSHESAAIKSSKREQETRAVNESRKREQ
jgi:uncharacterized protein